MSLANTVAKLSRPTLVTRRSELVYGADGRPDGNQTSSYQNPRLSVQPLPGPKLDRLPDGDESHGKILIHVTDSALAAVGWTELQIAPPEDEEGPPGDVVSWQGRRYEIVQSGPWQLEGFSGPAGFQRYEAEDRGVADVEPEPEPEPDPEPEEDP